MNDIWPKVPWRDPARRSDLLIGSVNQIDWTLCQGLLT
jgi:hypothetical protein